MSDAPLQRRRVVSTTVTTTAHKVQAPSTARYRSMITNALAKAKEIPVTAYRSWADVSATIGLPIVPPFDSKPYSQSNLYEYLSYMEYNGAPILEGMSAAQAQAPTTRVEYTKPKALTKLGTNIVLRPQQEKTLAKCKEAYLKWKADPVNNPAGILIPLKPGKGKSFVCAAFNVWLQQEGHLDKHPLYGVFMLTPASVVHKTIATFKRLGVERIDSQVIIDSHQSISSARFKGLFIDEVYSTFGNEAKRKVYVHTPPEVVFVDESHLFKKMTSKRTKFAMAWAMAGQTFFVFTSATPGVTLADMEFFCIASKVQHLGMPVTRDTFKVYASSLAGPRIAINMPNDAAMQRFRDRNAEIIIQPPDDPQKVRAYNHTVIVDFASERERQYYFTAEERFVEAKKKAQEELSLRGQVQGAKQVMRMAEETCKVVPFGERALKKFDEGFAPVVSVAFMDPLIDWVMYMTKAGVKRDDISIIWGGQEIVDPKDLLSEDEAAELIFKQSIGEEIPREKSAALKKTMRHIKTYLRRGMTPEEKQERDEYLMSLRLNAQGPKERYEEVERFLNGQSVFCIYTLPAGGTGIDLDHQRPNNRPRSLDSTVCWYAEEFLQALGRCLRVATLSDVHQYIVYMRGTISHLEIAPRLDKKLSSIHRLASGSEDYSSFLERAALSYKSSTGLILPNSFRSQEEIAQEEPEEIFGDDDTLDPDDNDNDN